MKLQVAELDNGLAVALATHMGLDRITLIHCGGADRVASEREQWMTDLIHYVWNRVRSLHMTEIILPIICFREKGIQVLEIPSSELSRGRGGPRCMSMPLIRAEL